MPMSNKVAAAYAGEELPKAQSLNSLKDLRVLDSMSWNSRSAQLRILEGEPEPMPYPQAYAEVNYATFVAPTQAGILAL
jgi:hypothetical protein